MPSKKKIIKHSKKLQFSPELTTAFDDLFCRFIFTAPEEELQSTDRFLFICERAHWFYLDFMCSKNDKLPKLTLPSFVFKLFNHRKYIKLPPEETVKTAYKSWRKYRSKVVVCGCILLNEDLTKCVLVKSYNSKNWCFPGGKINQYEEFCDCAAREVYEEIGINVSHLINTQNFIQKSSPTRKIYQFIVPYISEEIELQPKAMEIKKIEWFTLAKATLNPLVKPFKKDIEKQIIALRKGERISVIQTQREEETEEYLVDSDEEDIECENELGDITNPWMNFTFSKSTYLPILGDINLNDI